MSERRRSPSTSDSTVRVALVAICVGLLTVSIAVPVVDSTPDRNEAMLSSVQPLQSSATAGSATNILGFPPGTSDAGINNVPRLIEAHQSALNNSTYEMHVEWDEVSGVSVRTFTGFDVVPSSLTIATAGDRYHVTLVAGRAVNEYWLSEGTTAIKSSWKSSETSPTYVYYNDAVPRGFQGAETELLRDWLRSSTYDFTGVVTRNNRMLYEFWSTGPRRDTPFIEDAHARVLVTREGVVQNAVVTRTYTRENESVTARLNYAIQRSGVGPPTQPEWVSAELPHLDASVIGNGTIVALEHAGGATVSNATIRTFFPGGQQIDAENVDFEPGETVYLYRTETAPDRVLTSENEVPTVNESFVPFGEDAVLVSVVNSQASIPGEDESLLIEVKPHSR
jgi:hypothetical protein